MRREHRVLTLSSLTLQRQDSREDLPRPGPNKHACCHQDMCNRKTLCTRSFTQETRQKIETTLRQARTPVASRPPRTRDSHERDISFIVHVLLCTKEIHETTNKNTEENKCTPSLVHTPYCTDTVPHARYAQTGSQKPYVGHPHAAFHGTGECVILGLVVHVSSDIHVRAAPRMMQG